MWTSSSYSVQPYQTGPWIFVFRPRDQVSEPEPAAIDQITGLKSLSIYLVLLARLNLGLQMDRLPVQASQEALCSDREGERERERGKKKEACLNCVGTYLPGTVLEGCRLFKQCRNLPAGDCVTGVHGCISGIRTYLPGTVLQ